VGVVVVVEVVVGVVEVVEVVHNKLVDKLEHTLQGSHHRMVVDFFLLMIHE